MKRLLIVLSVSFFLLWEAPSFAVGLYDNDIFKGQETFSGKKGSRLGINISKTPEEELGNYPYNEKSNFQTVEQNNLYSQSREIFSKKRDREDQTRNKFNQFENNIEPAGVAPTIFTSSIRVVAAFLIVLSLMLITYYFVKKYLLKDGSLLGMEKQVKVISTNYLGSKKNITLVEIAGEVLVLGVTATNITMLTKIQNKEVLEKIKRKKERPLLKPPKFYFPFNLNNKKANKIKNKRNPSAFSKQLDKVTSNEGKTEKEDCSIAALNDLIQEKINKMKVV